MSEMEDGFVMVLRMVSGTGIAARLGRLAGLVVAGAVFMAAVAPAAAATSTAHVYLLSGLFNMSPGFDALAAKLNRYGIPATVNNHNAWHSLAADAIAQYKRGRLRSIVIIGHSMGGGAALDMAAELGHAGVPVALVVAIDPTGTTTVPPNVRRTVNLYVSGGVGSPVARAGRTGGAIRNLADRNPSIGHFSIIAAHERQLIGYVLSATGSHAQAAAAPKAASAQARSSTN